MEKSSINSVTTPSTRLRTYRSAPGLWERLRYAPVPLSALLWTVVALVVRLVMMRFVHRVDADGQRYLVYARNIGRGDLFHPALHWAPYPPFYPALIWLVSRFGLSLTQAGYAVSIVCGAALVGVIFLLAHHVLGPLVAHIAALLLALNGHFITYSDAVLSESTYYLLAFALLLLVVRCIVPSFTGSQAVAAPRPWLFVAVPLLAVAMTLTRYVGVVFPIALLIVALAVARRRLVPALGGSLVVATVVAVLALVGVSSAIGARLTRVQGYPAGNYMTQEFSHGLHDGFDGQVNVPSDSNRTLAESPLRYLRDHLGPIVKRAALLLRNDLDTGIETGPQVWNRAPILPFYLTILFVLGLVWGYGPQPRALPALLAPLVLLVLPNLVFVDDPRYYLGLVPVTLVFVAVGIVHGLRRTLTMATGPRALCLLLFACAALLYLSDLYYVHPN